MKKRWNRDSLHHSIRIHHTQRERRQNELSGTSDGRHWHLTDTSVSISKRNPCKGLAFRLEQRLIQDDIVSSNVMFEGEHVSQSIDEALTASESRGGNKSQTGGKEDVTQFLTEILANSPVDVFGRKWRDRGRGMIGPPMRT